MRICPVCKLAPRKNDPMQAVQVLAGSCLDLLGWPKGGYEVCRDCARVADPDLPPLPAPRKDAEGLALPEGWGDWWCSVCRRYMREDDPAASDMRTVRLAAEDVVAGPWKEAARNIACAAGRGDPDACAALVDVVKDYGEGIQPGAKRCCTPCFERWAPVVLARWAREGVVAPGTPWQAVGLNLV